jgi:branched-chain amino acid transport system permease protein
MPLIEIVQSGQLLFAGLVTGSLYALIGLGLNLVYGTMRMLNVAHGDLVMLGAYAVFWAFSLAGVSPLVAAPLVALAGAAVGWLLYRLLFVRLLRQANGDSSHRVEGNSLLLFFGLSLIIQNAAAMAFTANNRGYNFLDQVYHFGEVSMSGNRLAALVIAASACASIALYLNRSVTGLSMKAVIERREAAQVVGVNVDRVQAQSFALGFGAAALAGALISMLEQFSPFSGLPFTIAGFIVVILGGLGNVGTGLLAALLLGAIETYGVALTSTNLRSVLLYGTFVVALLVFPNGLLSRSGSTR